MPKKSTRVRRSLHELQELYKTGENKKLLEDLMRAWKGITELPPDNPLSFFVLGVTMANHFAEEVGEIQLTGADIAIMEIYFFRRGTASIF